MSQILLIEDQLDFQLTVRSHLKDSHDVAVAGNAADGLRLACEKKFDLILLDIGLPDSDGFEVMTKLRSFASTQSVPVIFLTAQEATSYKVTGFTLGADDYIIKPFEPQEFKARINSKLKLQDERRQQSETLRRGRLELNKALSKCYAVSDGGLKTDLDLTLYEFRLLVYFLSNEDRILSREELMSSIWGGEVNVLKRTIDRHVSALRRKLDPQFESLESVHNIGYRFSLRRGIKAS